MHSCLNLHGSSPAASTSTAQNHEAGAAPRIRDLSSAESLQMPRQQRCCDCKTCVAESQRTCATAQAFSQTSTARHNDSRCHAASCRRPANKTQKTGGSSPDKHSRRQDDSALRVPHTFCQPCCYPAAFLPKLMLDSHLRCQEPRSTDTPTAFQAPSCHGSEAPTAAPPSSLDSEAAWRPAKDGKNAHG